MSVVTLLIPLSIVMAGAFLWAFFRAVRDGQFDDPETPAMRMLMDESDFKPKPNENLKPRN